MFINKYYKYILLFYLSMHKNLHLYLAVIEQRIHSICILNVLKN